MVDPILAASTSELVPALLSALAAIAGALAALLQARVAKRQAKSATTGLKEVRSVEDFIAKSEDRDEAIGAYLFSAVGELPTGKYVRDSDVRAEVASVLAAARKAAQEEQRA